MGDYEALTKPERLAKIKRGLRRVNDVSLVNQERIVAADSEGHRVALFNYDGRRTILARGVHVRGVTASQSGLVVYTNCQGKRNNTVNLCMADGDTVVAQWGKDLWCPWAVAMNNKSQLVVSDVLDDKLVPGHSVGIYTHDGKLMSQFGNKGVQVPDTEQLSNPLHIAVDRYDRILVSDRDNHCVKVFDSNGSYLSKMGNKDNGKLLYPRGLTTDCLGHIYVCDSGNDRIAVFSKDGVFIHHLLTSSDGIVNPFSIDFGRIKSYDQSGHLVVGCNHYGGRFRKIRIYNCYSDDDCMS